VLAAKVIVTGVLRLQYARHKRMAADIRSKARRDLFYAKERRLAQVGRWLRPLFWATRVLLPRQTRRLELAIARCVALVRTRDLVRTRRRNFVAERKAQLLVVAARLERPGQLRHLPQAAQAATADGTDRVVGRLRVGLELMRRHLPERGVLLQPWADKLQELAGRAAATAKGRTDQLPARVYEAASQAARAGSLLERERAAIPVAVPAAMAAQEKEIQRVQARFYAARHGEVLSREMLLALSPRRVLGVLEEIRRAGLAEEGPAWALRQRELANLVKNLAPALKREMQRELGYG
jgi:hypothetical protein